MTAVYHSDLSRAARLVVPSPSLMVADFRADHTAGCSLAIGDHYDVHLVDATTRAEALAMLARPLTYLRAVDALARHLRATRAP